MVGETVVVPSDSEPVSIALDELVALETAVWEALRAGDAEADERLLSDDFLGVYPTGFADRADHVAQLAGGPTVEHFELSDARMVAVSPTDVLLAYRADFVSSAVGISGDAATMYVSSLWSRRAGRWVNTFSHDCPALDPRRADVP